MKVLILSVKGKPEQLTVYVHKDIYPKIVASSKEVGLWVKDGQSLAVIFSEESAVENIGFNLCPKGPVRDYPLIKLPFESHLKKNFTKNIAITEERLTDTRRRGIEVAILAFSQPFADFMNNRYQGMFGGNEIEVYSIEL